MAPSIVEEIPGQSRTNLTPSWIYSSVFCCLCSALLALIVEPYYYLCSRMIPIALNILRSPFSRLCLPGLIFKAITFSLTHREKNFRKKIIFVLEVYRNIMTKHNGLLQEQRIIAPCLESWQYQEVCDNQPPSLLPLLV